MPEAQKPGETKKRRLVKGRHRSAMKRERQNLKRAARNRKVHSRLKVAMKKVRQAAVQKDQNLAKETLKKATSLLAKAAARGLIHRRNASRHIARLSSLVHAL